MHGIDSSSAADCLHAQVLDDQGYNTPGFTGVPVFQAEGLTVKTDTARYTPVFLSKKDLDAAVGRAHVERVKQKIEITQAKVDRAQHEYADAAQQVSTARSPVHAEACTEEEL